jgi:hypothetical protein
MNMMVTPEQMRQAARYAEARKNLWFSPKKKSTYAAEGIAEIEAEAKQLAKPVKKPEVTGWTEDAPLWTWSTVRFDAHVKVWEKVVAIRKEQGTDEVIELELDFLIETKRPVKDIVLETLKRFPGITWEEVTGIHRNRHIVEARHACMYEVKTQRQDLSYPLVGRIFGGRDHTTVLHAVDKIRQQRRCEAA